MIFSHEILQFFHWYIQKQVHLIFSGYIQIWQFYRTLSRGLLYFYVPLIGCGLNVNIIVLLPVLWKAGWSTVLFWN